ncbi:USP2 [Cordylochernes scorpioides]|uniref:ubiquitinyl hydrolase 1 n=1 Tax=Cordylochernes scorpioides TaxID=51811 RepID=A0ABY6LDR6_9ARAC|nr:USP2 [Cordylochernes scorpioides]
MNSVVQCLAHTQPLLDLCLHNSYQLNSSSPRGGELMKSFASLLKSIWRDSGGSFSPNAFRSQVARLAPRFVSYSQQDGQEFLRYLLLGLHEDINRVSGRPRGSISDIPDHLTDTVKAIESWKRYLRIDDSAIVDTFVGQLKSSLRCDSCRYDSVTFDPFWDLSLPIPKLRDSVTLRDCLNLFTKEEILDGDEKPTCSKCKEKRSCVKSFSIYKFPKILVLHLKRFSPYEKYRTKLETTVDCPHTLDLGSYTSSSSQGQWHEFNDARVTKVNSDNVVSSKAYVLFYELNSPSLQSSRL